MGSSKLVALLGPSRKASPDTPDEVPNLFVCFSNLDWIKCKALTVGVNSVKELARIF